MGTTRKFPKNKIVLTASGKTPGSKFYLFSQNNSGGRFVHDDRVDRYVIIEAHSHYEANGRAEDLGIYFDGVDNQQDCECCGDRWYRVGKEEKGDDVPMIYGEPADNQSGVIVYYLNGQVVRYGDKRAPL